MTDTRKSGIALIAGSLGGILTMAIHPVAGNGLTPGQVQHLAMVSAVAHSLGMLSTVVLVLGAFGLTRRLAGPDRMAFCGLVFYSFAAFTILISAAVSGFIVPELMRHMLRDAAEAGSQWRIAINSIFEINQAFARIYTVASAIAMVLWAASALRNGGLGRGIALYGCIMAPLLILAICSGHLRLNVHGMAAVALAQAIWFIGAGIQLYGDDARQGAVGTG